MTTRRALLKGIGAAAAAMTVESPVPGMPSRSDGGDFFVDVLREPDVVRVFPEGNPGLIVLQRSGPRWSGAGVEMEFALSDTASHVTIGAENLPLERVHLRWCGKTPQETQVLGDAWERSYGELGWRGLISERAMPWYFMASVGEHTHGYGVKTSANAFAFWQCDEDGISLWLDVRNGGLGVQLGQRRLEAATIVSRRGVKGEGNFSATRELCKRMFDKPLVMTRGKHRLDAIYGSNDWYYAYGKNTPSRILRDADLMAELAPAGERRPFAVIDDGYQDRAIFPDMAALAADIRKRNVVPGIWIRPLRPAEGEREELLLPGSRFGTQKNRVKDLAYDPTIAEARVKILNVVTEAKGWGFELLKHDFTTYELMGQWGFEMNASPSIGGWHFHDQSKTNAEIINEFYRDIREKAGEQSIVLGCNTVGHFAAGVFDAQRTGDDVSGRNWDRMRMMGVNTLAFRLPQDGVFFRLDPDCVAMTKKLPWKMTEQWLRAVAATRSVLLVSAETDVLGTEQKAAIREAFAQCVSAGVQAEPVDWKWSRTPSEWSSAGRKLSFDWITENGASPFPL